MTGPTASIAVSAPLPGLAALPSFLSVSAPAAAGVAVPSLATFVDLMIGKAVAPQPKPPVRGLQDDAGPGKSLPDGEDQDAGAALAWLFAGPPIIQPAVAPEIGLPESVEFVAPVVTPDAKIAPFVPDPVGLPIDAPVVDAPSPAAGAPKISVTAPVIAPVVPFDLTVTPADDVAVAPLVPTLVAVEIDVRAAPVANLRTPAPRPVIAAPAPVVAAPTPQPIVAPVPQAIAAPAAVPVTAPVPPPTIGPVAELPVIAEPVPVVALTEPIVRVAAAVVTRVKVAPAPVPAPPVGIAAPAIPVARVAIAQIIAGGAAQPALFALAAGRERSSEDDARSPISAAAGAALLLQPTDAATLIAKPGGAQGQALDMGRQDWPNKMIDHIEALRDNADAADTSIRLRPEALGRIDIAVRAHGGGAVSVHFTADQPTTRTLLVDAQPQLQAAAEARGIKLTGASVDLSGSHDHTERGQPRFEAKPTSNNRLAPSAEDSDTVSDGRVA